MEGEAGPEVAGECADGGVYGIRLVVRYQGRFGANQGRIVVDRMSWDDAMVF